MTTPVRILSVMSVYLIDSVRGTILHKVQHKGAHGAVNMVQGENWVAYHYRNRKVRCCAALPGCCL